MYGMGHRDINALGTRCAALVYTNRVLHSLGAKPACQFHDSHARWIGGLCDTHSIGGVIRMSMADQHEIDLVDVFEIGRAGRVLLCPGIDQNNFALWRSDLKSSVSQPGDLRAIELHVSFPP